jgi:hypothetical protein
MLFGGVFDLFSYRGLIIEAVGTWPRPGRRRFPPRRQATVVIESAAMCCPSTSRCTQSLRHALFTLRHILR